MLHRILKVTCSAINESTFREQNNPLEDNSLSGIKNQENFKGNGALEGLQRAEHRRLTTFVPEFSEFRIPPCLILDDNCFIILTKVIKFAILSGPSLKSTISKISTDETDENIWSFADLFKIADKYAFITLAQSVKKSLEENNPKTSQMRQFLHYFNQDFVCKEQLEIDCMRSGFNYFLYCSKIDISNSDYETGLGAAINNENISEDERKNLLNLFGSIMELSLYFDKYFISLSRSYLFTLLPTSMICKADSDFYCQTEILVLFHYGFEMIAWLSQTELFSDLIENKEIDIPNTSVASLTDNENNVFSDCKSITKFFVIVYSIVEMQMQPVHHELTFDLMTNLEYNVDTTIYYKYRDDLKYANCIAEQFKTFSRIIKNSMNSENSAHEQAIESAIGQLLWSLANINLPFLNYIAAGFLRIGTNFKN